MRANRFCLSSFSIHVFLCKHGTNYVIPFFLMKNKIFLWCVSLRTESICLSRLSNWGRRLEICYESFLTKVGLEDFFVTSPTGVGLVGYHKVSSDRVEFEGLVLSNQGWTLGLRISLSTKNGCVGYFRLLSDWGQIWGLCPFWPRLDSRTLKCLCLGALFDRSRLLWARCILSDQGRQEWILKCLLRPGLALFRLRFSLWPESAHLS